MLELIILMTIAIILFAGGVYFMLFKDQEDEEDDTPEIIEIVPVKRNLDEHRIAQIQEDSEITHKLIMLEEFNSKIKPLEEYIKHIELEHKSGHLSDENFQKELALMNETIGKFENDYGIKRKNDDAD